MRAQCGCSRYFPNPLGIESLLRVAPLFSLRRSDIACLIDRNRYAEIDVINTSLREGWQSEPQIKGPVRKHRAFCYVLARERLMPSPGGKVAERKRGRMRDGEI